MGKVKQKKKMEEPRGKKIYKSFCFPISHLPFTVYLLPFVFFFKGAFYAGT